MAKNVDLGFFNGDFPDWSLEKEFDDYELESRYFPSKVGGAPGWLDLSNLPTPTTLTCRQCSTQMRFLLQVYAPGENEQSFHRTIFVFICSNDSCWKTSTSDSIPVLILRNQLTRENRFYPAQPPVERAGWRCDIVADKYGKLCPVCGCRGDKMCARCKQVWYCSQAHQKLDWKYGHKQECTQNGKYGGPHARDKVTFVEGLIEIEEEPEKDVEKNEKDYSHLIDPTMVETDETSGLADVGEDEWNEVESSQTNDKASEKFSSRLRRAPQQILRYQRHGDPLLCTFSTSLQKPPNCPKCDAKRSFEFQVTPQLLSITELGSSIDHGVDWGSVYVFTCSLDCYTEGYVQEHVQILNFDQTSLPVHPES